MRNAPYNGHKNWSHWNVSLWLMNEEYTYNLCVEMNKRYPNADKAARALKSILPARTPDGARYSLSALRATLIGLKEDY